MSLSRTDLVPVLAIVAGGMIGASLSFGLLESGSDDMPAPELVVVPALTLEDRFEVEIESLQDRYEEQQRLLERIERGKRAIEEYVEITPHYHFAAREFKAIGGSWFVARNVTLNFDDVPVFWLPFILQSTRVR